MTGLWRKLSMYFSAGALGGLINSVALWVFGSLGLTASLGVRLAPSFTVPWLYPRIVWGGIWGAAFLVPVSKGFPLRRGFLLSLAPTAFQLFYVFPRMAHKGMFGFDLGTMTPAFVIVFNAVWGITAAYWLRYVRED